jgi:hypothetical protein
MAESFMKAFLDIVDFVEDHGGPLSGEQREYLFTLVARVTALEARLADMEKMYDKVAADLIEALDVASAYRATASTLHQEVERRTGVERRTREDSETAQAASSSPPVMDYASPGYLRTLPNAATDTPVCPEGQDLLAWLLNTPPT